MEMLCTIRVWYIPYAYMHIVQLTVRVWYGYLYHMRIATKLLLFTSNIIIIIIKILVKGEDISLIKPNQI